MAADGRGALAAARARELLPSGAARERLGRARATRLGRRHRGRRRPCRYRRGRGADPRQVAPRSAAPGAAGAHGARIGWGDGALSVGDLVDISTQYRARRPPRARRRGTAVWDRPRRGRRRRRRRRRMLRAPPRLGAVGDGAAARWRRRERRRRRQRPWLRLDRRGSRAALPSVARIVALMAPRPAGGTGAVASGGGGGIAPEAAAAAAAAARGPAPSRLLELVVDLAPPRFGRPTRPARRRRRACRQAARLGALNDGQRAAVSTLLRTWDCSSSACPAPARRRPSPRPRARRDGAVGPPLRLRARRSTRSR